MDDYANLITSPFDPRLFAERIDGGEKCWDSWGRDFGEDACRKALVGLGRVRIHDMLIEDGRLEPKDFEERLRSFAPSRSVRKKPTQDEMFETLRAELDAA